METWAAGLRGSAGCGAGENIPTSTSGYTDYKSFALAAPEGDATLIYPASSTSISVDIQIVDDTGLPVTGLVAATFPTLTYSLAGANSTVSFPSLSDLAALTTAYHSGGVKERSGGYYRLDLPNGVFTTAGKVRLEGEASGKHVLFPWIDVGAQANLAAAAIDTTTFTPAALASIGMNYLSVTGSGTISGNNCADIYYIYQIYNGLPAFKSSTLTVPVFYWYSPSDLAWAMSLTLGTEGSSYFLSANNQMDSLVSPNGTANGSLQVDIGGAVSTRQENWVIQTGTLIGISDTGNFILDKLIPNAIVNQIELCLFRITRGVGYPLVGMIATYDSSTGRVEIEPYSVQTPAIGDSYSVEFNYLPFLDFQGQVLLAAGATVAEIGPAAISTTSFDYQTMALIGTNYLYISGTGTLGGVDVTGVYPVYFTFNGLPSFTNSDNSFFYWYSTSDLAWIMSTAVGTKGSNYFQSANNQLDSTLIGHGTTTGPPKVYIGGPVSTRPENRVIQTGTIAVVQSNGVFTLDKALPNTLDNQVELCMFRITRGVGYPLAAMIATYDHTVPQIEIEPYSIGTLPVAGDEYSIEYAYLPILDGNGSVTFRNTSINSVAELQPMIPDTPGNLQNPTVTAHTANSITLLVAGSYKLQAGPGSMVMLQDANTGIIYNPVVAAITNRNTQTPTITFEANLPVAPLNDGSWYVTATWAGTPADAFNILNDGTIGNAALLTAIENVSGGGGAGSGAYAVNFKITSDGTTPILGAVVRISGAQGAINTTNSSGIAAFSLNAGVVTVTVTAMGFYFIPVVETLSGAATITLTMTANPVVTPSPDPSKTTVYFTCRHADLSKAVGVAWQLKLVNPESVTDAWSDSLVQVATSDSNGLVQIGLAISSKWQLIGPNGQTLVFSTGAGTTTALPGQIIDRF